MGKILAYKFRALSPRTLAILENQHIWYSHPADLNDTYEFSIPAYIELPPAALVEHYRKRFGIGHISQEILGKMMAHSQGKFLISDHHFAEFLNASQDHLWLYFIALIHYLNSQGLSDENIAKKLRLDENTLLRKRLETELRSAYEDNLAIGRMGGVLSLCAEWNHPLLWAHYADSFKGICIGIEYDLDEIIDAGQIPLWVDYLPEPKVLDPNMFFDRGYQNMLDMLRFFYSTKHDVWKYEKELRLFTKEGNTLLPLGGRIAEIIIGERTPKEAIPQLVQLASKIKEVKLFALTRNFYGWDYQRYGIDV